MDSPELATVLICDAELSGEIWSHIVIRHLMSVGKRSATIIQINYIDALYSLAQKRRPDWIILTLNNTLFRYSSARMGAGDGATTFTILSDLKCRYRCPLFALSGAACELNRTLARNSGVEFYSPLPFDYPSFAEAAQRHVHFGGMYR